MRKFTLNEEQVEALCERAPVIKYLLHKMKRRVEYNELSRERIYPDPIARLKGGCAKAALQILGVALPGVAPTCTIRTSDLDGWSNFCEVDDMKRTEHMGILNPSSRKFESQCNGVASAYMGIDNPTAKCSLFVKPGLLEVWVSDQFSWHLTPIAYPWQKVFTYQAHDLGWSRSIKLQLEPSFQSCIQECKKEKWLSPKKYHLVWNRVKAFASWANDQSRPIEDGKWLFYHNRPNEVLPALNWSENPEIESVTYVSQSCVMDMIRKAESKINWDERSWTSQYRLADMDRHICRSIAFSYRYGMELPRGLWGIKLEEWEIEFVLAKGASQQWVDMVMKGKNDYNATKYEEEASWWFPGEGY